MQDIRSTKIKEAVREAYANVAKADGAGCGCSCSEALLGGYSMKDLEAVPEGAKMGLGSGNPLAVAALVPGETVLDLGSGGGIDCFLAAKQVGETGLVIGVDMTPEMVAKARRNAEEGGFGNVDFRLGEIENLPVADGSVDVILSNCVINLSPDKAGAYREAFRVLKPGGRLAVSDIVLTAEVPDEARDDLALHAACVAGAASFSELERILSEAGFENVRVHREAPNREHPDRWSAGGNIADYAASAIVEAVKPGN